MINISVHISLLCQLGGLEENDTPVAVSTASTQILVSNTNSISNSHKRNQNSGKMADPRTGTGNKCLIMLKN